MLLLGATLMLLFADALNSYFLSYSLTAMLVYIWSKRNRHIRMSLLGLITFRAPYLPFVLLGAQGRRAPDARSSRTGADAAACATGLSLLYNDTIAADLLGMGVGHIYYFFEDVYQPMTGRHVLRTPALLCVRHRGSRPETAARSPLTQSACVHACVPNRKVLLERRANDIIEQPVADGDGLRRPGGPQWGLDAPVAQPADEADAPVPDH